MNVDKDRAERIMKIRMRLAELGMDITTAVNAGNVFEVERIITEQDHLHATLEEAMAKTPPKVTDGQDNHSK
jgi:hypothetical protein